MFSYPHRCKITRYGEISRVEGRPIEGVITAYANQKCFLDETFSGSGANTRTVSADTESNELSAVLFVPADTDIRPSDTVTVGVDVFEVNYSRKPRGLRGVDHLEVYLSRVEQR